MQRVGLLGAFSSILESRVLRSFFLLLPYGFLFAYSVRIR